MKLQKPKEISNFANEERKSHQSDPEEDFEEKHLDTVLEMTLEDTKNDLHFID